MALDEAALRTHIETYLQDPTVDGDARRAFVEREITFTDGSAGRRTGEYLASLAERMHGTTDVERRMSEAAA